MFRSLFDPGYKEYKRNAKQADKVMALEDKYRKFTDEQLREQTVLFKERLANGENLDDIAVEAFAVVREAADRTLGLRAYKVQVIGAFALHGGNIAEMKTGEGKTLTSTMPAYLNALSGEGVHIVTVNEYLAARDAEEMGRVFKFLGLTVGLNLRELTPQEKREAYAADITYSTNNELGFDYLRDHMVLYKENIVQRPLNYAIVDEVDSILIDEARTPLIISGGAKDVGNLYRQADLFVKSLNVETDVDIDVKARHAVLAESGMEKAERFFSVENLYDIKYVSLVHHINNALRANYIMEVNVDYVVQDNKVIIVDSFTGRLMHGRQYSEGLHQALEAKEHVEIKKETRTVATITFQNYFRMYKKLSGMTGTAKTEEEEFRNIYNMYVVVIPTNEPVIRIDDPDLIFSKNKAKYKYIVQDVKERYLKGQPVLLGTVAIETSELLSELLTKAKVPHNVLNAKQPEREAEIVANAGMKGSVTIATNMAGRGTDIKLGPGVRELGGLAVIGTERHESRRIDNQLRGRAGRQGDPGYSRFYLSAEDDLLKRFGSERFETMLAYVTQNREGGDEIPLESKMFSKFVENAQKKIEGSNFDARKTVLEYDEVLRVQREIIYEEREQVLFLDDVSDIIDKNIQDVARDLVNAASSDRKNKEIDHLKLHKDINGIYFHRDQITLEELKGLLPEEAKELLIEKSYQGLKEKQEQFPPHIYKEFLKVILLRVIDTYWMDHIDAMSELRDTVRLQAYAQIDPLRQYRQIGFEKFEDLIYNIEHETVKFLNRAQIRQNLEREEVIKPVSASSGKEDTEVKRKPVVNKTGRVGRNDPCPCGSGKKYKNCCGR